MTGPARRRTAALVAAVALTAGGGSAIGWAATHQQSAPQPSAGAAGTIDVSTPGPPASPSPSATPSSAAPSATRSSAAPSPTRSPAPRVSGPVLPAATPTRITIPAISVNSPLIRLGAAPDGSLQVPSGANYDKAAWFTGSPSPGQAGPAVIEGHVDSAAAGPAVFFRLGALRPGDTVRVQRSDGRTAIFTVNAVRRYPKDAFPTTTVYANTDHAALRLITCGGSFDHATGHYRDNIVVFAHLTGSTRSTT